MTSGSWSAEYENHDDGPTVIRTCAAVSVLAFLFVGLRLWARRMKGAKLALDDWLVVVALVCMRLGHDPNILVPSLTVYTAVPLRAASH